MRRIVGALVPARLGRDFRWLFGSSWITNIGDGIELAAGPLLIAAQTRDPGVVALAVLVQRVPWLLVGVWAGVLVDRLDRRRVAVSVNSFRGVVVAVLAVIMATGRVNVPVILVTLFVLGIAEVFADITKSTLLPMVVEKRELGLANARIVTAWATANQLVGPPIGAFLFAVGMAVPFGVQAACMALGAVLISRIAHTPPTRQEETTHAGRALKQGFRWLWNFPPLRTLAVTVFVFNITFGAAWSILVLVAIERLEIGEIGFGLMTSVGAIGGLLGAAFYQTLAKQFSLADLMRIGLIVECITHLTLATTKTPWVAMTVLLLFGAHNTIWFTTTSTIRQRAVPTEYQGRIASINQLGSYGGLVLGTALGGVIASRWGLTGPFWFAFVGAVITLTLIWKALGAIALVGDEG